MLNIDRDLKSYLKRDNRSDRLNYALDVTKGMLVGILFMIMIYLWMIVAAMYDMPM